MFKGVLPRASKDKPDDREAHRVVARPMRTRTGPIHARSSIELCTWKDLWALGEISPQGILPLRELNFVVVQACGRENGIGRAAGWARKLGSSHGFNGGWQSGNFENFFCELVPGTVAGVGGVHDALSVLAAKLCESDGEIGSEGRRSTLIVHYGKFGAAEG